MSHYAQERYKKESVHRRSHSKVSGKEERSHRDFQPPTSEVGARNRRFLAFEPELEPCSNEPPLMLINGG